MAILYQCKVVNCYSLNVRSGPGTSYPAIAWLQRDDVIQVDGISGEWYKIKGVNRYCKKDYLQITKDMSTNKVESTPSTKSNTSTANKNKVSGSTKAGGTAPSTSKGTSNTDKGRVNIYSGYTKNSPVSSVYAVQTEVGHLPSHKDTWGQYYLHTSTSYPKKVDEESSIPKYDWYMDHRLTYGFSKSLFDMYTAVQKNFNLPSYYTREAVNKNIHVNFNRFRLEYPDIYMSNSTSVIIFTRPDLNLFDRGGNRVPNVANDPRTNLILSNHRRLGELLTERCTGRESHKFNPLLSNLAQSLEVSDDNVQLLTTGETYVGYKMQYSKHNIESLTSGTLNIKFKETYDLAITRMHQLWVDYESNVYRGIFVPRDEYIWRKVLDYACDVYYFLLDRDNETIRFWSKYYGVFPQNVPKSTFGWDAGSTVSLPEVSVTYSYIYKEDLSPVALLEFNKNAGVSPGTKPIRINNYNAKEGLNGTTWVGAPFIYSYNYNDGIYSDNQGFKLGWKQA